MSKNFKLIILCIKMHPCLSLSFDGKLLRVVNLRLLLYKADLLVCVPIMIYSVWLNNINKRERKLNNQQWNCFISVCMHVCVREKMRVEDKKWALSSLHLQSKVNVNMRFNSPSRVCMQVCCCYSGASRTHTVCCWYFTFPSPTHIQTHATEYQCKQLFTITIW